MIINFFISLSLTIIIETIICILFKYRDKYSFLSVIIINVITNPALNFIILANTYYSFFVYNTISILILEICVVIIEWLLLTFTLKYPSKKMFLLSLAMNIWSYSFGIILFDIFNIK